MFSFFNEIVSHNQACIPWSWKCKIWASRNPRKKVAAALWAIAQWLGLVSSQIQVVNDFTITNLANPQWAKTLVICGMLGIILPSCIGMIYHIVYIIYIIYRNKRTRQKQHALFFCRVLGWVDGCVPTFLKNVSIGSVWSSISNIKIMAQLSIRVCVCVCVCGGLCWSFKGVHSGFRLL